jgi:inner membrane protein
METPEKQAPTSIFQSATARMIMVGFLSLFLLIPLEFVKNLINERSLRKQEVVNEVANLWGKDVQFYGPMLKIPYKTIIETEVEDAKTKKTTIQRKLAYDFVYFLPETLNNKSNVKKNTSLKRGIYNNVVFTANMNFDGNFAKLNCQKLGIKPEDIIWEKTVIVVKTTNLKSIKSDLKIKLNEQTLSFESKPSEENDIYGTLETDFFDYKLLSKNENIDFSFNMTYNGSNSVEFVPVGKVTNVSIDSDWESPSFDGAFSKNDTTFTSTPKGFHADWKVLEINRPFSQQFTTKIPNLTEYAFGVTLLETVNEYQQNERVSKYGFLVIALTFIVFFMIQSISKIKIHIFQYSMIGLALIMFYTLLISITEHSSFALAYLIASISVIAMIILYSISILQNKKFPIFIGLSLIALYTFIFVIIQLENYALLVGSIGLFMILGAIMYFSRRIDWNK